MTKRIDMSVDGSDRLENANETESSNAEKTWNIQPILEKLTKTQSSNVKEFIAELVGIFLLISFGCGSVAQLKFSNQSQTLPVNIAFGFGVMVAILVTGKISGCHINPAVSFAMLITGRMSLLRFFIYVTAQIIGAFLGALLVFILYIDALRSLNSEMNSLDTAGIFATYPNPNLSTFGGFLDQVIGTFFLIIVVLAVSDKKNVEIPHGTKAIILGLTLIAIGVSFGHNCGYAINPARDLGPRLFTLIAGWGDKTFTTGNYFFWIPIVGPMVGSLIACVFYYLFISGNL